MHNLVYPAQLLYVRCLILMLCMDIKDFNTKLFGIIDVLESTEAKELSEQLYKKGCYGRDFTFRDIGNDIKKLKDAIKIGVQKISIEDLDSFAPPAIKQAIQEFIDLNEVPDETFYNQPSEQTESKDSLIQEAIQINSQRRSDREEIPRDLQKRMGYIIAKLNVMYKLPRTDIAKLINIHRNTVNDYAKSTMQSQPDLIKMWGQSVENKTNQKVEETISKHVGEKAISTVRDNINLGDGLREKYAVIAAQRGYNLYSPGDLEKLVNSAVLLFFSNDAVYANIIALETENTRLRCQVNELKEQNKEIGILQDYILN